MITSLLIFLLFIGAMALGFTYVFWSLNGKQDGDFRSYLKARYQEYRESWNEKPEAQGKLRVIRSKDLPEAPPRKEGEHEDLALEKSAREAEIERLNKLFGDS